MIYRPYEIEVNMMDHRAYDIWSWMISRYGYKSQGVLWDNGPTRPVIKRDVIPYNFYESRPYYIHGDRKDIMVEFKLRFG